MFNPNAERYLLCLNLGVKKTTTSCLMRVGPYQLNPLPGLLRAEPGVIRKVLDHFNTGRLYQTNKSHCHQNESHGFKVMYRVNQHCFQIANIGCGSKRPSVLCMLTFYSFTTNVLQKKSLSLLWKYLKLRSHLHWFVHIGERTKKFPPSRSLFKCLAI